MKIRKACFLAPCCLAAGLFLSACGQQVPLAPPPPIEVSTVQVLPRDVALPLQYVGQAESSRLVEIRARVDGYLQKKLFHEGVVVRQGDPLFLIDPRPLQAVADSAAAALQDKENWADNARRTRDRMQRLLAENAVSQKDVEDALAAEKSASAALAISQTDAARANMNLSYASITSPLTGLVGRANVAEGSYVNPGVNGLLTTVAQIDPIWVNFSISENEWLRLADESKQKSLVFPVNFDFDVEMLLADGRSLNSRGRINFASPSVDTVTGAYAMRASFANPDMGVRPGQFVRVRLHGMVRPKALLVPQRAVMQGQSGKFVYVVADDGKAEIRPVEVGDWHQDDWFINKGLQGGEQVIVGGVVKVQAGRMVKVVNDPPSAPASASTKH